MVANREPVGSVRPVADVIPRLCCSGDSGVYRYGSAGVGVPPLPFPPAPENPAHVVSCVRRSVAAPVAVMAASVVLGPTLMHTPPGGRAGLVVSAVTVLEPRREN